MPPETGSALRAGSTAAFTRVDQPIATTTISATVLFVDLRGYTALAEQLPPAAVANLLDEFFAVLSGATERHGGQVFSMIGDGMMAGFGLRSSEDASAHEALAAAQAMLKGFAPIVARWRRDLSIESGIGIGLHRGEVALCQHGPPGQRAHTLVGDTVNVAARLCARARAGEVLFSAAVAAALESLPQVAGGGAGAAALPASAPVRAARTFLSARYLVHAGAATARDLSEAGRAQIEAR